MSRFDKCPINEHKHQLTGKFCDNWSTEDCEGCPLNAAYHIGRADALIEAMAIVRSVYKDE